MANPAQWMREAAEEIDELHNLTDEHDADVAAIIAHHAPSEEQIIANRVYRRCNRCGYEVTRRDWESVLRHASPNGIRCVGCHGAVSTWRETAEAQLLDRGNELATLRERVRELVEAANEAGRWLSTFGYNRLGVAMEDDNSDHRPLAIRLFRALEPFSTAVTENVIDRPNPE